MNILFLAARDSSNFAGIKMIKEFMSRGHQVYVYDKTLDEVNIRMFRKCGIEVKYFDELTDEVVDSCDIMFAHTTYTGDAKIRNKMYTFFFNHIFVYGHENNSDFVFVQSDDKYNAFPNKVVMKIGSPKLDRVYEEEIPSEKSNRILFIETGHYPFGKKGREQVARLILKICMEFQDYTITVKPRYLPTDTRKLTRRNTDHIYGYVNEMCNNSLPPNLELLYEHYDLEEMIYQSHSVVCYASSSYLEAASSGRGVIYVEGIDSVECIGDRKNKYWKAFTEYIEDSGIAVPYDEVTNYLPNGILCKEEHLDKALYSKEKVTEKIVEVTEYVWNNFLSKGIYPKPGHYEYNNYLEELKADLDLTKDKLIVNNKFDVLVYNCQRQEQAIGADLDFTGIYQLLEDWKATGYIEREELKALAKDLGKHLNLHILEHAALLMHNKIDQTILIKALFDSENPNAIIALHSSSLLAKDAYCYYMGLYYCSLNEHEKGLKLIDEYFEYVKRSSFDETFLYYSETLLSAFNCAFVSCAVRGDKAGEIRYLKTMNSLAEEYLYDVLNYDMRCARICYKKKLNAEVWILVENWLNRKKDGIQLYRVLELDVEAYLYKAEIAKMNGDIMGSEAFEAKKKHTEEEMIKLITSI